VFHPAGAGRRTSGVDTLAENPPGDAPHDAVEIVEQNADRLPGRLLAALAGLVSALVALAVAGLVAAGHRSWRSPVLDVGDRIIDAVPSWVKDFAIDTFGTNDKPALLIGIGILLAVYALVLGLVALRHRLIYGIVGIALFGLIGAWAANGRRAGAPWHVVVPSLVGALAGIAALILLDLRLVPPPAATITGGSDDTLQWAAAGVDRPTGTGPTGGGSDRRRFLGQSAALLFGLTCASAGVGVLGRVLGQRYTATESRASVRLPIPAETLPPLPSGTELGIPGLTPFVTPNADFYRIDTALSAPQVPTDDWVLRVTGMVDNELELTYEDLLARDLIERDITLTCVSNEVGGRLAGTARWLGTRLDDLLSEAGVQEGADQIVGRSVDGYTCGFPVSAALDGRDALVAVAMNGEPLPIEHGFPARLIVPGLYGYVSATKWLTEIEVTTFADHDHYWARRGWATEAPIKLFSRIDTPKGLARVPAGMVAVAGVAWRQAVGVTAVEVQIDDDEWQPAELGEVPSVDTWVQWRYAWQATPGRHTVRVRAIDAEGDVQTADRAEPIPDGASGHHQIVVIVE